MCFLQKHKNYHLDTKSKKKKTILMGGAILTNFEYEIHENHEG